MKKTFQENIDEILKKNDIVDVVSEYISIIKKGKNFVCLCPFHNDTNPSMVISQEKQIYKCFSCGAGGNALTFVKNYEKISLNEAIKKLANKAGVEIDYYENNKVDQKDVYLEYYNLNDYALNLFQYLIKETNNQKVLEYINKRNYSKDLITKFKIGFLDNANTLTNLFKSKEYDLNNAVEIGLLKLVDNKYFDSFSNRIIYPIINEYDKIVGFTARAIDDDTQPKYLNSPESKIFDKSSILYNLNNAKESATRSKTIYLVEGPNDVIAFDKAGYSNSVCVMGTALTIQHLNLLKKLKINNLVIAFDDDEAGINATLKAANLLKDANFIVSSISFNSLDPDDFLKEHGLNEFKNKVENSIPIMEFIINYEFSQININNYLEKKELVVRLLNNLFVSIDNFDKEYYFNYMSKLSGFSLELINSLGMKKSKDYDIKSLPKVSKVEGNDVENASKNIIYYLMKDKIYYDIFKNEVGNFVSNKYRKLYNVISMLYLKKNEFNISDIYTLDISQDIIDDLTNISLSFDFESEIDDELLFNDCLKTLNLEVHYQMLDNLNKQLKVEDNPLKKAEISGKILSINKEINEKKKQKFNK